MIEDPIDHHAPYIVVVEDLLDAQECVAWIEHNEAANPTPAPILTVHGEQIKSDVRNNDRTLMKDEKLASLIFSRAKEKIPKQIFGKAVCGLNELFRCYRYAPGMRFAPHTDGAYQRNEQERSHYTFLIYLNEVDAGGETNFLVEPEVSVSPKPGLGVIFQHSITHEGAMVDGGLKYVMRTDVMYRS